MNKRYIYGLITCSIFILLNAYIWHLTNEISTLSNRLDTIEKLIVELQEASKEESIVEEKIVEDPPGYIRDDVPLDETTQRLLHQACDEFVIPYELALSVIWKETNYRNVMGDHGNAYGYMQIWKKWCGPIMEELSVTDLNDPLSNFRVGCYILRGNYNQTHNWESALTKYNTGSPGTSTYAKNILKKWEELKCSNHF